MKFTERLQQLRLENKVIQSEVAKALRVARTTYASYEQGAREPDLQTLSDIGVYFNVSVDYLTGTPMFEPE